MTHFSTTVVQRRHGGSPPQLRDVWQVADSELSPHGQETLGRLSSDPSLNSRTQRIAWGCQTVLEFQDLQSIPLPQEGPFLNVNYLFYQGIDTLRESVLGGINGLYHSSFGTLRSSLEHFVFHQWWRSRLKTATDYSSFYDWLGGKKKSGRFTPALLDVCSDPALEHSAIGFDDCYATYETLCSYTHKPLIADCITNLKGTNEPAITVALIGYWLKLLELTLSPIVEILVAHTPQCLFPVPAYRKFGFSPPVGVFFDDSNFIPLHEWLGTAAAAQYAHYFRSRSPVTDLMKWYGERGELSDDAILETWDDEWDPDDSDREPEERVIVRWSMMKARLRSLSLAFAYGMQDHSVRMGDGTAEVTTWRTELA